MSGAGDPESGQRGGADARQAQMGSRALPAPQPLQVHKGPGPQAGVHRAAHAARAWTPCPRPPPWRASRHLRARVLASCSPAHLRLGRRAPQPAGRAHGGAQSREPRRAAAGTRRWGRARRTREAAVAAAPVGSGRPPRRSPRRVYGRAAQVSVRAGPGDPAPPARHSPHARPPSSPGGPLFLSASPGCVAPHQAPSAPPGNFGGPVAMLRSPCPFPGRRGARSLVIVSLETVGTPGGMRSPPKGVRMGHWLGLGTGDGRVRSLSALPSGEVWSTLGGCAKKAQEALTPGPAASLGWGQSSQVGGFGSTGPGPLPRGPVSSQQQGWGGGFSLSPEAWHRCLPGPGLGGH